MANENPKADLLVSEEMLNTYHNEGVLPVKDSVKVTRDLIKSTVGFTGKNLLKWVDPYTDSPLATDLTYTQNNGTLTVTGTVDHSATYGRNYYFTSSLMLTAGTKIKMSCAGFTGTTQGYIRIRNTNASILDINSPGGEEIEVTIPQTGLHIVLVRFFQDQETNVTLYPMIKLATDTDASWEPYHEDVVNTLRDAEVIPGKNLLKNNGVSKTIAGVVWSVNTDGTVSASGAPTGDSDFVIRGTATSSSGSEAIPDKILPGSTYYASIDAGTQNTVKGRMNIYFWDANLENTTVFRVDFGTGVQFTVPANAARWMVELYYSSSWAVTSGTQFKPMICTKEEWDKSHDYEPYYVPVKELAHAIPVLEETGAVNECPNDATSQVISGVTFTVNSDGTVSLRGTASADIKYNLHLWEDNTFTPTPYRRLTGCPSGGSNSTYKLRFIRDGSFSRNDYGDGVLVDTTLTGNFYVRIEILSGTNCTGFVFKPMLSDARLNLHYEDYVPYAMTNRELTEGLNDVSTYKIIATATASSSTTYATLFGNLKTAYSNLSEDQKLRAEIWQNSNGGSLIFKNFAANIGVFQSMVSSGGKIMYYTVRFDESDTSAYRKVEITTGGAVTNADFGSTVCKQNLYLVVK